jgi:phosphotransferase system  glucose/maltose/N-acetylglucosamine-specific IIC component
LGDIFSDAYYVLYDYSAQTIGFNGYMQTGLPIIGEKSEKNNSIPIWIVIILAIVVMALIGCILICILNKRKSKLRNLLDEYEEDGETAEKKKKNIHEVDLDDY